jgi:1,6-anhydro-N-acetylmuramate kinase
VVADFRSRDVAAGGKARRWYRRSAQLFGMADRHRVVVNIGIANITDLPRREAYGLRHRPGQHLARRVV